MTTGSYFKKFLQEKNLTIKEISDKTGIPEVYFKEVLNNQLYLKKRVIRKIVKHFPNLSIYDIDFGENLKSEVWNYGELPEELYDKPLVLMTQNKNNNKISYICAYGDKYGFYIVRGDKKLKAYLQDKGSKLLEYKAWRLNR